MLYLEDYLELIEHLPQETVDGLTDMRELDLQVQNSLDNIKKRIAKFFQNAYRMKSNELESEHGNIMKEYRKALEDTEEKVQLANTMTDSLTKYMRRLDQDIMKFKMELEADNSGITDIIEKRLEESASEEISIPDITNAPAERHRRRQTYQPNAESMNKYINTPETKRNDLSTVEQKFQRLSIPTSSTSHSGFNVDQVGSTIAAAASQAIAATQQMQQGRRSASLKASYEAINASSPSFSRAADISALNVSNVVSTPSNSQQTQKRHRRRRGHNSRLAVFVEPTDIEEVEEPEPMDPDEPRYCICNEVAFGGMVACDNPGCPYEWYHYPCVGITEAPEGKWYCPQCIPTMKKRSRR